MRRRDVLAGAAAALAPGRGVAGDLGWRSLFDGSSLAGWTRTLAGHAPGDDPKGVFRVVTLDGGPALRVSGELIGGLTSTASLEDYHLRLEFKWGEGRHGPRARAPRDSGLLYHGAGAPAPGTGWLESIELGILEGGETGDFWSVPGALGARLRVDVEGEDIPFARRRYREQSVRWRRGGAHHRQRLDAVAISADHEKRPGAWNTVDLYCFGQAAVHAVNGSPCLALFDIRRKAGGAAPTGEPVTRGLLQLQSEYAETFYRAIRWRLLEALPAAAAAALPETALPNTLTAEERRQGWRLLFDGRSLAAFRGVERETVPAGWRVQGGRIELVARTGDLATRERFARFELALEWRLEEKGNGGVFYWADLARRPIHRHAPEYELRDNGAWLDDPWKAGAAYGLKAGSSSPAHPPGAWNHALIRAAGDHVEHWLNGVLVVGYDRGAPGFRDLLAAGPFRDARAFADPAHGHIVFQDHGARLGLRNIKVRPLG